jgi:Uma2 family endonuclease
LYSSSKADLTVYLPGRVPPARGAVTIPPDVAVEVVSPSPRDQRRDSLEKMEEYARFGIQTYWVVDPQARSLEIFVRGSDGAYVRDVKATAGALADIPICPGLRIDLDAMWAKLAALGERATSADGRSATPDAG